MLCNEQTLANFQKRKIAVKGPHVKKISNPDIPQRCEVLTERPGRVRAKRKKRKVSSTVFKVNLPIRKGSVLLERTSFTVDSPAVSSAADSSTSDTDLVPSPEPQSEDCELDCDSRSFTVNHTENTSARTTSQQDLHGGHAEGTQYAGPGRNFVTHYQVVDGYFSDNAFYNQPEYASGTEDQRFYGENNRQPGSQGRSSKNVYNVWQNEGPPPVSHTQDWASYNSYYGHEEQWYNSASQTQVPQIGTRAEVSENVEQRQMMSDATQFYSQQHPPSQYIAQDHTSALTGSMGQRAFCGEPAPRLDAARINMYLQFADYLGHSGSIVQEPQVHENEQRWWQPYTEFTVGQFQSAQQCYLTPPTAYQAIPGGHGAMPNPSYNNGPTTNCDQHYPHYPLV